MSPGPDGRATFTVGFHVVKESCEARGNVNFGELGTLTEGAIS